MCAHRNAIDETIDVAGHDYLTHNNGQYFSTPDRDNDQSSSRHCAQYSAGAWWHGRGCGYVNLNGRYDSTSYPTSVHWYGAFAGDVTHRHSRSLKFTEMKLRRDT